MTMEFLFSFEGRIRRSQWWLTRLVVLGVEVVFIAVFAGISALLGNSDAAGLVILVMVLLGLALFLTILWIDIATGVKRFHDQDLSGAMLLLLLIPGMGLLIGLIFLGCIDGTPGFNRYGPSAKFPEKPLSALA